MNPVATRTVLQRAALTGVASAFLDLFYLGYDSEARINALMEQAQDERSAQAKWHVQAFEGRSGTIVSFVVRFKNIELGGVHFMADYSGLILLAWNRGEILYDGDEIRMSYLEIDLDRYGIEPIEDTLFLQVLETFRIELYRYLKRHRHHMRSPCSKLLNPTLR